MDKLEDTHSNNIQVICRFRPYNESELLNPVEPLYTLSTDHKIVTIISEFDYNEPLFFAFDQIYESDSTQEEIFQVIGVPIVEATMQGFNGTIFAYGQTSSGKTYTMTGPDVDDQSQMGIIPRIINTIFDYISNSDPYIEFSLKVSYCEIYLEKIRDLLDSSKINLKIHEDKTRGVYIGELTEKYVSETDEVMNLMKLGLENRKTGSTNMNQQSSRSHSLFIMTVNQMNNRDFISRTGKLYLVDLAGSEKVAKTSSSGLRLEEAKNINKSLTLLGLVIYSLSDGKSTHIPYRDSKLTRVLKDSLGGNSKTSLIVTCSPSKINESETISTLRFGIRAKKIKNRPKINKDFSVAELKIMLGKCREELDKKDLIIKNLEERCLSRTSIEIPEYKEDLISSPLLDPAKMYGYEDLLAELEDTKNKLAEEILKNEKLRNELAYKDSLLAQQRAKNEALELSNSEFKAKSRESEKKLQEQSESLEKFIITQETLEKEVKDTNSKMLLMERNIIEKDLSVEPVNLCVKAGLEELRDLLVKEKEENSLKAREIEKLQNDIKLIIGRKPADFTIQEVLKHEIARQEQAKWSEEKNSLVKDLQARINRIIELEIALEDFKQAYWNLEGLLTDGEKALKRKTDTLERNLEQLTLMYHQLITQKSQISVEKTLAEKKFSRTNEALKALQSDLQDYKDRYERETVKTSNLTQQLEAALKGRHSSGNVLKTIKGGKQRTCSNVSVIN